MIHIGAWLWGRKYPQAYVDKLQAGIERHVSLQHRFHVWKPMPKDNHLTAIPGCFARLRTFDPEWQSAHWIWPGDKIVVLDLDLIVTGSLDAVLSMPTEFAILQGVNAVNRCPYNGSMWMLAARYRPDVVSEFSLDLAAHIPHYLYPDDQAWFADRMPDADSLGPHCGVYAFKKPGWPPHGVGLPKNACVVAFPGARDPSQFVHIPWVREHWK